MPDEGSFAGDRNPNDAAPGAGDLLNEIVIREAHLAQFRALIWAGKEHGDLWTVNAKEAKRLLVVGAGKTLLDDYLKTKALLGALLKERQEKNAGHQ